MTSFANLNNSKEVSTCALIAVAAILLLSPLVAGEPTNDGQHPTGSSQGDAEQGIIVGSCPSPVPLEDSSHVEQAAGKTALGHMLSKIVQQEELAKHLRVASCDVSRDGVIQLYRSILEKFYFPFVTNSANGVDEEGRSSSNDDSNEALDDGAHLDAALESLKKETIRLLSDGGMLPVDLSILAPDEEGNTQWRQREALGDDEVGSVVSTRLRRAEALCSGISDVAILEWFYATYANEVNDNSGSKDGEGGDNDLVAAPPIGRSFPAAAEENPMSESALEKSNKALLESLELHIRAGDDDPIEAKDLGAMKVSEVKVKLLLTLPIQLNSPTLWNEMVSRADPGVTSPVSLSSDVTLFALLSLMKKLVSQHLAMVEEGAAVMKSLWMELSTLERALAAELERANSELDAQQVAIDKGSEVMSEEREPPGQGVENPSIGDGAHANAAQQEPASPTDPQTMLNNMFRMMQSAQQPPQGVASDNNNNNGGVAAVGGGNINMDPKVLQEILKMFQISNPSTKSPAAAAAEHSGSPVGHASTGAPPLESAPITSAVVSSLQIATIRVPALQSPASLSVPFPYFPLVDGSNVTTRAACSTLSQQVMKPFAVSQLKASATEGDDTTTTTTTTTTTGSTATGTADQLPALDNVTMRQFPNLIELTSENARASLQLVEESLLFFYRDWDSRAVQYLTLLDSVFSSEEMFAPSSSVQEGDDTLQSHWRLRPNVFDNAYDSQFAAGQNPPDSQERRRNFAGGSILLDANMNVGEPVKRRKLQAIFAVNIGLHPGVASPLMSHSTPGLAFLRSSALGAFYSPHKVWCKEGIRSFVFRSIHHSVNIVSLRQLETLAKQETNTLVFVVGEGHAEVSKKATSIDGHDNELAQGKHHGEEEPNEPPMISSFLMAHNGKLRDHIMSTFKLATYVVDLEKVDGQWPHRWRLPSHGAPPRNGDNDGDYDPHDENPFLREYSTLSAEEIEFPDRSRKEWQLSAQRLHLPKHHRLMWRRHVALLLRTIRRSSESSAHELFALDFPGPGFRTPCDAYLTSVGSHIEAFLTRRSAPYVHEPYTSSRLALQFARAATFSRPFAAPPRAVNANSAFAAMTHMQRARRWKSFPASDVYLLVRPSRSAATAAAFSACEGSFRRAALWRDDLSSFSEEGSRNPTMATTSRETDGSRELRKLEFGVVEEEAQREFVGELRWAAGHHGTHRMDVLPGCEVIRVQVIESKVDRFLNVPIDTIRNGSLLVDSLETVAAKRTETSPLSWSAEPWHRDVAAEWRRAAKQRHGDAPRGDVPVASSSASESWYISRVGLRGAPVLLVNQHTHQEAEQPPCNSEQPVATASPSTSNGIIETTPESNTKSGMSREAENVTAVIFLFDSMCALSIQAAKSFEQLRSCAHTLITSSPHEGDRQWIEQQVVLQSIDIRRLKEPLPEGTDDSVPRLDVTGAWGTNTTHLLTFPLPSLLVGNTTRMIRTLPSPWLWESGVRSMVDMVLLHVYGPLPVQSSNTFHSAVMKCLVRKAAERREKVMRFRQCVR